MNAAPADRPALQGILLDMDGVLVDSEPILQDAIARLFAAKGIAVQPADYHAALGTGEEHILEAIATKHHIAVDIHRAKAQLYALYLDMIPGRLQPLPGVFTFLAEARKRGLKLAVASSADRVKVERNLAEASLAPTLFDAVIDGGEVTRKKPFPDLFLAAAERLGLPPQTCLVVEDAIAGVAAAKAAGCRCLALTTTYAAEQLTQADWIAPNLADPPQGIWVGC